MRRYKLWRRDVRAGRRALRAYIGIMRRLLADVKARAAAGQLLESSVAGHLLRLRRPGGGADAVLPDDLLLPEVGVRQHSWRPENWHFRIGHEGLYHPIMQEVPAAVFCNEHCCTRRCFSLQERTPHRTQVHPLTPAHDAELMSRCFVPDSCICNRLCHLLFRPWRLTGAHLLSQAPGRCTW
jgi:hypothetical protein